MGKNIVFCKICQTEHDWSGYSHADWSAFCACGCRCPAGPPDSEDF